MSKKVESAVKTAVQETVENLGFELADVSYAKDTDAEGMVLTLYIYRPEGVGIDDCELISRAVDPIIDALDPIQDAYYLSVSSLGIERPFTQTRDFERYLHKEIEIKFYAPITLDDNLNTESGANKKNTRKKNIGKKKEFVGILQSVDDESLEIEIDGVTRHFKREVLAKARPHVVF